jgi:hypothetical protein
MVELLRSYLNATIPDISLLVAKDPGRKPRKPGTPHRISARLSEEQVRQVCSEYQRGVTTRTIATRYRIGKTTVTKLLREHDVPLRHQGLDAQQVSQAVRLYRAGKSVAQVGAELNFHPSSVNDALRTAGVEMRPRHESGRRTFVADLAED